MKWHINFHGNHLLIMYIPEPSSSESLQVGEAKLGTYELSPSRSLSGLCNEAAIAASVVIIVFSFIPTRVISMEFLFNAAKSLYVCMYNYYQMKPPSWPFMN